MRLGGVFQDENTEGTSQFQNRVHVYGMSIEVDDNNSLGSWSDARCYSQRIHIQGPRVAIDQDRRGIAIAHGVDSSDVGQRRYDDLIAWADTKRDQSQVQGRGAIIDSNSVLDSAEVGKCLFKFRNEPAGGGDPGGLQTFHYIRLLIAGQQGGGDGN